MTGIEVLILIATITIVSLGIGYYMNYGQPSLKEMEEEIKNDIKISEPSLRQINEVVKEVIGITETKETKPKRKYYPKKKKQEGK